MRYLHNYEDDPEVSESTSYYYATEQAYTKIFVGIIFTIVGVCFIINTLEHSADLIQYFTYLFVPVGIYAFIKCIRELQNKTSQITLSEEGITTPSKGHISWDNIDDASISHSGEDPCFVYIYNGKKKYFALDVYGMKEDELEHLLKVYLIRHQEKEYLNGL
jgi:hypothetical protein